MRFALRVLQPTLACLGAALIACGGDSPTGSSNDVGGFALTGALTATLTGAAVVPVPGDPDGRGTARITLDQARRELCFQLVVADIDPAFAAHIHLGAGDVEGPIAIGLAPPTTGTVDDCLSDVSPELIAAILEDPSGYYVNVHTTPYPAGAVRGQLTR